MIIGMPMDQSNALVHHSSEQLCIISLRTSPSDIQIIQLYAIQHDYPLKIRLTYFFTLEYPKNHRLNWNLFSKRRVNWPTFDCTYLMSRYQSTLKIIWYSHVIN